MEGTIKVSPAKLTNTAGEFSTHGTKINNLMQEMMEIIKALQSIWEGDAYTAYLAKFQNLQKDIQKINRMVQEHAADLEEMAENYKQSDQSGSSKASGLRGDVIY